MKKLISIAVLLGMCGCPLTYGQIDAVKDAIGGLTGGKGNVVYDPTNKAQLAKVIAESKKTYGAIKKQLELLDKAREVMVKVNAHIRQIRYLDDIKSGQQDINKISQQSIAAARELNVVNDKEVIDIISAINNNLIAVESMLNLANHLLEDDFFKMSTAERVEALYKIRSETLSYRATAIFLNQQIRQYASVKFLNRIYGRALPSMQK